MATGDIPPPTPNNDFLPVVGPTRLVQSELISLLGLNADKDICHVFAEAVVLAPRQFLTTIKAAAHAGWVPGPFMALSLRRQTNTR
jgi:hypothetical protein